MTMFRLHPNTDKSQPKVLRVTVEIFLSLSRTLFSTNVSNVLETVHSFFLEGQKGENLHFMKLENVTGIGLSDLALLGLNTLKSVWIECQKTFGKEGIDFFFMEKNLLFHLWLLNSLWCEILCRHKKWGPLHQELKYEDKCYPLHS